MLSEEYKKQAFDLLEQMSAEELEEVLQKIGSIKASKSNTVRERRRMNRFDNFFPCFDELMQMGEGGKCKIVLKYHSVPQKSDATLKASFCINRVKTPHGIDYKTIENYTGGTGPSWNSTIITGLDNRYSLETLLLTLFDDDFQKRGKLIEMYGGGVIYYGDEEGFIQDLRHQAVKVYLIHSLENQGCTITRG